MTAACSSCVSFLNLAGLKHLQKRIMLLNNLLIIAYKYEDCCWIVYASIWWRISTKLKAKKQTKQSYLIPVTYTQYLVPVRRNNQESITWHWAVSGIWLAHFLISTHHLKASYCLTMCTAKASEHIYTSWQVQAHWGRSQLPIVTGFSQSGTHAFCHILINIQVRQD